MLRRTIKKNKDLKFVVIYTREPHARQFAFKKIGQPVTWKERCRLARKTREELKLDVLFLVDDMGDPSRKVFGDVPNPAIFVEKNGKIRDKLSWADASEVDRVIKKWKAKATSRPASREISKPATTPGKLKKPNGIENPASRPSSK